MDLKKFGNTTLKISPLGIGGNIFSYALDQKNTNKLLDYSYAHGINFIDTADVYSNGDSETIIGNYIEKNNRDKWIISTKVGLQSNSDPSGLGARNHIISSVEKSLKRLRTDYIDIYQLHHFDPSTNLEETLSTFEDLIKGGKIRYAGCSNFDFIELKNVTKFSESKELKGYSSVQQHFNLLKRAAKNQIFPFCKQKNMGTLIYGALGRGLLSDKYLNKNNLENQNDYKTRAELSCSIKNDVNNIEISTIRKLNNYAINTFGKSLQQLAVAWVLNNDAVSSVILGFRTLKQIKEIISSLIITLTEEDLISIDSIIGDLSSYNSLSLGA
jgi:1-deoxyxylulose-5-phosphate synthase